MENCYAAYYGNLKTSLWNYARLLRLYRHVLLASLGDGTPAAATLECLKAVLPNYALATGRLGLHDHSGNCLAYCFLCISQT